MTESTEERRELSIHNKASRDQKQAAWDVHWGAPTLRLEATVHRTACNRLVVVEEDPGSAQGQGAIFSVTGR